MHCSISPDSFGSLPVYDAMGRLVNYEVILWFYPHCLPEYEWHLVTHR